MPALISQKNDLASYPVLVRQVRHAIQKGKARAQDAVERELLRTKWEIGKLILQHILLNQDRASYDQQVLRRLSKDLGMSETDLGYMVQFARAYPISPALGKLSWFHYRELLAVNDPGQREEIGKQAVQKKWTGRELSREIKKLKIPKPPAAERLTLDVIVPGKPGVCRIVEKGTKKYYDLGFYTYLEVKNKKTRAWEPSAEDRYTYLAEVTDVYDGDTFHARIDLGFGVMQEMRVRLLRVNAPEIITAEGLKAKKVLEKIVRGAGKILIQSKELDQHGRPLANVFLQGKSIDPELLKSGVFTARTQG